MLRVALIVLAFLATTLLLLPFQLIGLWFNLRLQHSIPHLYHRLLCALIGVRISEVGTRSTASPALILSNHVSWLDIPVVSALSPVVFVAKSEVAGWPVLGWLAKLQRTVFINRQARHQTGAATSEIAGRLLGGDAVVLFAEGTSSDGNRVLPFRSALVGAAQAAMEQGGAKDVAIQPVTIAYTHLQGLPVSRNERSAISGMNARGFRAVVTNLLTSGVKDVTIAFGAPIPLGPGADRKVVTKLAENQVRRMLVALNRHEKELPAVATA